MKKHDHYALIVPWSCENIAMIKPWRWPCFMRTSKIFLSFDSYWILWQVSSGSKSTEVLVLHVENSTLGWESFWGRYPEGSRFSRSLFRHVPETVPESIRSCGFKRSSSNLDRAPKMRSYTPAEFLGQFFNDPALNLLRNLRDVLLSNSRNGRVLWTAVPTDFLRLLWNSCQLSFISQRILSKMEKAHQFWRLNYFYFKSILYRDKMSLSL